MKFQVWLPDNLRELEDAVVPRHHHADPAHATAADVGHPDWTEYQEHEVIFLSLSVVIFLLCTLSLCFTCAPKRPPQDGVPEEVSEEGGTDPCVSQIATRTLGRFSGAEIQKFDGWTQYVVSSSELIDDVGISGLCVLDPRANFGLNGVEVYKALPLIALQSLFLQMVVLLWLALQVHSRDTSDPAVDKSLPPSIVFFAVYVHFISCTGEIAFNIFLAGWILSHEYDPARWVMAAVFASDAFLVPISTVVIGSLYLINSANVAETILNCCAVAFISSIDNWILMAQDKMNGLTHQLDFHCEVKVWVHCRTVQWVNWSLTLIPVLPAFFTLGMMWIGRHYNL